MFMVCHRLTVRYILAEDASDLQAGERVKVAPFPWCFNG